jgi:GAF domain-containing protein
MSTRQRLLILLLLVGLVPLLFALGQGWAFMQLSQARMLSRVQASVEQVEIQNFQEKVQLVSRQLDAYLETQPNLASADKSALRARLELENLAVNQVGKTGYTFLFTRDLEVIHHPDPARVGVRLNEDLKQSERYYLLFGDSVAGAPGAGFIDWVEDSGRIVRKFVVVYPVGTTTLRLAGIIDAAEFAQKVGPLRADLVQNAAPALSFHLLSGAAAVILAAAAAVILAARLTSGMRQAAEDARRILLGLPDPVPPAENADEIITLHNGIVNLAMQNRQLHEQNEQQEHAHLEDVAVRSLKVEAVVQLANELENSTELPTLLARAADLISDRFEAYHAGIYLLDEAGEYAILAAASSPGGKRLVEREYKLKLGGEGIVSWVASNHEMYTSEDTFQDPIYQPDPELPHSLSALGLPLQSQGELIGVLDIQALEARAFSPDDCKLLQIMAGQLTLALKNAQLQKARLHALDEVAHLYQENVQSSWKERRGHRPMGYVYNQLGVEPALSSDDKPLLAAEAGIVREAGVEKLIVPVKLRGQLLGKIVLSREATQGSWLQEELLFLQEVAEQVAPALENARLLEEMNRKAVNEQLVSQISARALSTLSLETLMRTAVQEIGAALDADKVQIRLTGSTPSLPQRHNGKGMEQ